MAVQEQGECPRQPWYKERVTRKYLQKSNRKQNFSGSLDGSRWFFLERGLDDFRDGYPLPSRSISFPLLNGTSPVLQCVHDHSIQVEQKPSKRFTKGQAVFSKLLPLQQAKREYIEEIEDILKKHPIALYPHLEDGIPPRLFEEILDILDPEMRAISEARVLEPPAEVQVPECPTPQKEKPDQKSIKTRGISTRRSTRSQEPKYKNPYKLISTTEGGPLDELTCKTTQSVSPGIPESVKEGTEKFCEWVTSLGGDHYNIDESTIYSLFASGYDIKPALSVPIHVVELNNIPAELRRSVGVEHPALKIPVPCKKDPQSKSEGSAYHPSWVKIKYGAWYLDPKIWTKLNPKEPLKDPTILEDDSSPEAKLRLKKMNAELMDLHGTTAFRNFVSGKGYREPEFLVKIFSQKDFAPCEDKSSGRPREGSSKASSYYRYGSASTHEDTPVN